MPSPESVINDDEYSNTIETLTTYNTLSYLSNKFRLINRSP